MSNIIIYNPNSFGGNYNYAHSILNAYVLKNIKCELILPSNAQKKGVNNRRQILLADIPRTKNRILKKLYFFFRSMVNPFIFFFYLLFKKSSKVIFNDYDQSTAFFWVPFFFLLRLKHDFAVILHDPDRDKYFPYTWMSAVSMKFVMALMDYGIYHEVLPNKGYYNNKTKYFSVPHGIYNTPKQEDVLLSNKLKKVKSNYKICTILGNIRKEKNYEMAIEALQNCSNLRLIIAGKNASSGYTVDNLKKLADRYNVQDKIIWIDKYLSEEEINSVLRYTDVLLLNYSSSFKSQSGILNIAAPHKSHLLVSETESALYKICKTYNLAEFIEPDNPEVLKERFLEWDEKNTGFKANWDKYYEYASWKNNIEITLEKIKSYE